MVHVSQLVSVWVAIRCSRLLPNDSMHRAVCTPPLVFSPLLQSETYAAESDAIERDVIGREQRYLLRLWPRGVCAWSSQLRSEDQIALHHDGMLHLKRINTSAHLGVVCIRMWLLHWCLVFSCAMPLSCYAPCNKVRMDTVHVRPSCSCSWLCIHDTPNLYHGVMQVPQHTHVIAQGCTKRFGEVVTTPDL